MAKKKTETLPEREPTERELAQMKAAVERRKGRPGRVEVKWRGSVLGPDHRDIPGHLIALEDAVGTTSHDFLCSSLGTVEAMTRARGETRAEGAVHVNAALALLGAIAPENEFEAALAMQMTGVHSLACEMLYRAKQSDCRNAMGDYGALAVKLTRTFTAQVEALAKLRGGGRQLVEVKHVYVNGNAVVGDVHNAPGGGAQTETAAQPHAKALAHDPGAQCSPMRSPDPIRDAMRLARGEGPETLPDARRD